MEKKWNSAQQASSIVTYIKLEIHYTSAWQSSIVFILNVTRWVRKDFEGGLRAPSSSLLNTEHGSRTEGWPLSLTLSWSGIQVWIRQPAVTADHGSCQPENFSRQSRFIGKRFQARLMPGLRWRIALWCSHWARRLRLTHGRAMVTWLITGEIYGEKGDGKHKAPIQSILLTGNSARAPNLRTGVQ